jgi:hypothetical protein
MPDENDDIDESLFPNPEDAQEAEEFWSGGIEENDRARPTGSFQANIDNATLERSSSGDRLQIHYELTIITPGTYKDTTLHKYDGLGSKQQASITQNQLRRLGVDTKKVSLKTLPATLLTLKNKKCIINCRIKGDYHNVLFTKLLGDTPLSAPRQAGATGVPAGRANGAKPTAKAGTGGKKF